MRVLRWFFITLLVLALVGAAGGTWLARRSFPTTSGQVALEGLDGLATVVRDDAGVPHITASTSHDLFMAQGYVHAQDRFWQMDMWRHIGAGRLSELFGESQVDTDMFLRSLGFERLAEAEYEMASPEAQEALDAYAAGVNAYLAERGGSALSLEYAVLSLQRRGYEPAPWEPSHTLTWAHMMAWDLRSNLESEIDRALLAEAIGSDMTEDLYPPYPDDHGVIVGAQALSADGAHPRALPTEATDAVARAASRVASATGPLGRPFEGLGSNNWVVSGDHTESGLPLLANDPHLGIQLPSIWYQATLWCEEVGTECPFRVTGFTFPGAPGVVVGHNERIAWGVTNEAPDTMDLFIERFDGDSYEVDGEWMPLQTRTETIEVAGGADVDFEVRSSHRGPLISTTYGLEDLPTDPDGDYEAALAWQALEPSTLVQALLEINQAANWDEFRQAASLFDIAPQNLVYADVDGHIGYQATGEIPIRRSGDGRYPVPGWTSEHDWEGLIAFGDLPSVLDPPGGMIVTANQPVVDQRFPHFIGVDHDYGYRAGRIQTLLEGATPLTVEDMSAIHVDEHDASAEFVVPAVLALDSDRPAVVDMQAVLDRWSSVSSPYQMRADSAGAAAYAGVWRHLLALTFDELPEDRPASGNSRFFVVMRGLLSDPENRWWDRVATDEVESAADVLEAAVVAAHEELTEMLGDDIEAWQWGDLHVASFENQTLGQSGIGPIEAIFNRTSPPVGGGSSIVNATGWAAPEGYDVLAVPSFRMVVDLGDFSRSVAIHTTGQSGHAFHTNYFDMADDWARGVTRPMPFEPTEGDSLRLVPSNIPRHPGL